MLASFQINASLPGLVPAVPLRAAPVALPGTAAPPADFGAALGGLLIPGTAPKAKGERQPDAERGKDLPVEDDATPDPVLAWLPMDAAPMPLTPVVAAPEGQSAALTEPAVGPASLPTTAEPTLETASAPDTTAKSGDHPTVPGPAPQSEPGKLKLAPQERSAEVHAIMLPAAARAKTDGMPATGVSSLETEAPVPRQNPAATVVAAAQMASEQGSAPVVAAAHALRTAGIEPPTPPPAGLPQPTPVEAPVTSDASLTLETLRSAPELEPDAEPAAPLPRGRFDAAPAREAAQPAPAFVPLPAAPPVANAGIAAQVFAAAITTAATDPAPFDGLSEAVILFNGQARTEQQTTVQAMSGASQAPLDMTRDDWTGQMIERIAALRDSAEAADTRIKLAPENLGALEVSIRRDGDRIHVHFTADNPAARQLIADAAPRLAELADARGVKLGQTSVDGGSQQGAQRDAQQQQQRGPGRNASVAHRAEPVSDDRIA
nr:flagellar hook-length control protein FliK [Sphingomonas tagetis]